MGIAALNVKRVRLNVYHVTYTDGSVENLLVRFVVRGSLPAADATTIESMGAMLNAIPEGSYVHAVYQTSIRATTATLTGRLSAPAVLYVIGTAGLMIDRCSQCSREMADGFIRDFNSAAFQVFRGNFEPICDLARSLQEDPAAL